MSRKPQLLILILLTAGIFAGCGIPSIPYLEPPIVSNINIDLNNYTVNLQNTTMNNPDNFQGYSFFYRFFLTETTLDEQVTAFISIDNVQTLKNAFYNYIYRFEGETGSISVNATPQAFPTLYLDSGSRNDSFSIIFSLSGDIAYASDNDGNFGANISYNGETIYLGRYITQDRIDPASYQFAEKSFKKISFSVDDADLPDDFGEEYDYLFLSVYAASFGRDNFGSPFYSEPVNIGKFELPVSHQ